MPNAEFVTTVSRLFLNTCREFPKPELLKSKVNGEWRAISTEEFGRRVRRLSLGLRSLGFKPGDKAVYLKNTKYVPRDEPPAELNASARWVADGSRRLRCAARQSEGTTS